MAAAPLLPPNLSAAGVAPSLRDKQIGAIQRMLNLNNPLPKSQSAVEPVWKVLVYDKCGQDIISPLLPVKELRDLGVTLHLPLDSDREAIQDTPAVYFIAPTSENIKRVCQDLRKQLYSRYFLNFISPLSRALLEDLAQAALDSNAVGQVAKVYDQYLNFVTLEDDLFVARHSGRESISYYALNQPDAKDADIQAVTDVLVDSLFAVLATAGTVPVIRCPRGNAAEMVAQALDKKLRDNLRDSRNNVFSGENMTFSQLSLHRPLLVILDRGIDLATPMHHTWTYQALAHDILDLSLNRVTVAPNDSEQHAGAAAAAEQKTYDLTQMDTFWQAHRGSPFPTVADAIQSELEEYKQSEEEVKHLKTAMGVSEEDDPDVVEGSLADNTARLTSAVSSLPELLEKKKRIDTHTNIAMAILEHIKTRKLDTFFEMEEKMLTKATLDKTSYLDLIKDPTAGTPEDKIRLFAIYYILAQDMLDSDFVEFSTALEDCGADLRPLRYLKKWKAFTKLASAPRTKLLGGGGGSTATATMTGVFSRLMSSGSKFVMEGVKNLVIRSQSLPVTRMVEQLVEQKASKETDGYCYFDPKMLRSADSSSVPRSKTPFQEAIVFVVGGGNYIEYLNLQEYARRSQPAKRIVYGSSDLVSAREFLQQLSRLGERSQ